MKEKRKSSKLGLLIVVLVILVLGGLAYFFLLPIIFKAKTNTTSTNSNTNSSAFSEKNIEDSIKELDGKKDFGQPVSENEPTGRANPFAPI